ncbi:MAG: hypothetical protein ACREQL_01990 [Candidatus Binatia bacterium]
MRKTKAKTRKTTTKPKARPGKATKATRRAKTTPAGAGVWPGLPPGYFDRAR